ncbi:MAG: ATP-binding protein [Bacteriovoracaceae bacterium]|nr:ATP-binding protein [Bacteriovoracaceae bacterium]
MYERLLDLPKHNSFFLFGARGTGKSFWLNKCFPKTSQENLWIDLLLPELEISFSHNPSKLIDLYTENKTAIKRIIIDEVQKVPKLLDVAHKMIEEYKVKFVLTGSSARKLKRGNANLLAGRAFTFSLFPLNYQELGRDFNLEYALNWGTLAKLFDHEEILTSKDRERFLRTYVHTYLKEEILSEQIVRNLDPFHRFLEVAAQMSGEPINYSAISREAKTDDKNVARYFDVLVDTLMGIYLPAYHQSVRKQQLQSPKFYFFDIGVIRALKRELGNKLAAGTYEYGKLFEHFIILEIHRLNLYLEKDFKLYYLKSNTGKEIDLIIERPGQKNILIEIKSGVIQDKRKLSGVYSYLKDFPDADVMVLSQNTETLKLDDRLFIYPWELGIGIIFNN